MESLPWGDILRIGGPVALVGAIGLAVNYVAITKFSQALGRAADTSDKLVELTGNHMGTLAGILETHDKAVNNNAEALNELTVVIRELKAFLLPR